MNPRSMKPGGIQFDLLAPSPYHLTAVPGTGKLYVSSAEEDKLWVVDQRSLAIVREILIPGQGHQMAVVSK